MDTVAEHAAAQVMLRPVGRVERHVPDLPRTGGIRHVDRPEAGTGVVGVEDDVAAASAVAAVCAAILVLLLLPAARRIFALPGL